MRQVLRFWLSAFFFVVATHNLQSQASVGTARAQEDFALAVATSHARTGLLVAGLQPSEIHATVTSSLALRGTGKGTYEMRWADAQHWHRVVQFPDFQQTEMRNDSGHHWVTQSSDTVPLRVSEMLSSILINLPSSTRASAAAVTETETTEDDGKPLACYSVSPPTPGDGFPRRFRYCFEKASGLLVSLDAPLSTHVVYGNYIAFQGKSVFTHVRVLSGGFQVLDMEIQYAALAPHVLDGDVPIAAMHRSKSAESSPNPEELENGVVEYRYSPPLPAGTPDAEKDKPVRLRFRIGAENDLLDACLEDAPTQAMAEAALQAARRFTFTSLIRDGKPVAADIFHAVWFRPVGDDGPPSTGASEKQTRAGQASTGSQPPGGFQSADPSFLFHYPAGFERMPRGELEEHMRAGPPHRYGLDPGVECSTLLFKAQRLRAGERFPEVVAMYDLAPTCVFGSVDHKALGTIAVNLARSAVEQLTDGSVSKPKEYKRDGRTFAVVSASAVKRGTTPEPIKLLAVVTTIHHYVVAWTMVGGDDRMIAQALAECTLQTGDEKESAVFALSDQP